MKRADKREEGIYDYYVVPGRKEKDKREEGIYDYYVIPGRKEKDKREEGIYDYYVIPGKDKREGNFKERSPQDLLTMPWSRRHELELQWLCCAILMHFDTFREFGL